MKNTKSKSKKQEEPTRKKDATQSGQNTGKAKCQDKPEEIKDKSSSTFRNNSKYPYLKKNLNTKRRQDYLDNIFYVEGVKSVDRTQKEDGIRALNDDEKEWLNTFNKEFYGASFEKDDTLNLHKKKASDGEIQALRDYITSLRDTVRDEKDSDVARELYEEIEMKVEELCEMYPQKSCTDANNARNRCLLNYGKATNEVKLIPWESLDQSTIGEIDVELLYIQNGQEKDDED